MVTTIVDFLPKKTQEQVKKEETRFEKAFKLKPGTVTEIRERRARRSRARTRAARTTGPQPRSVEQQRAESARKAAERQAQREVAEAGTIESQLKTTRQPAAISAFDPSKFQFESGMRRDLGEATRSFATETVPGFIAGVGPAIGDILRSGTDTRSLKEIDPFRVFRDVGPRAGSKTVFFQPQFGTVTPDAPTGFKPVTGFDLLRKARVESGVPLGLIEAPTSVISSTIGSDIRRDVTKSFQARVDTGQLSAEEATRLANVELSRQFKEQTSALQSLGAEDLRVRTGERTLRTIGQQAPAAVSLGLILGGTALGGPVGGITTATGGGLSLAIGTKSLAESGEAFREGRLGAGTIKGIEAGLFLFGGAGAFRQGVEGFNIAARTRALQQQPLSLGGVELAAGEKGAITRLSFSRATPAAAQEVEVFSPVFAQRITDKGIQEFSVVGGKLRTSTRVTTDIFPAGPSTLKTTEVLPFTGRGGAGGVGRLVGRDTRVAVEFGESVVPSIGTVDVVRGEQVLTSGFAGGTQRGADVLNVLTGRPTGARIPTTERSIFTFRARPTGGGPIRVAADDIVDIGAIEFKGSELLGKPQGVFGTTVRTTTVTPSTTIGPPVGGQRVSTQAVEFAPVEVPTEQVIGQSLQTGFEAAQLFGRQAPIQSFGTRTTLGTVGAVGTATTLSLGSLSRSVIPSVSAQTLLPGGESQRLETQVVSQLSGPITGRTEFTLGLKPVSGIGLGGGLGGRTLTATRTDQAFVPGVITDVTTRPAQRSKVETGLRISPRQRFAEDFLGKDIVTTPAPVGSFGFGGPGSGIGLFGGLPVFGSFGGRRRPSKFSASSPGRVAPSLTGVTLFSLGDITGGPLPVSGLPVSRLVPKSSTKKKRKKSKKK